MRTIAVIAVVLIVAGACLAQGMRDSSSVVAVTAAPDTVYAGVGGAVAFTVSMTIEEGWHLYAHGDTTYYGISFNPPEESPLAGLKVAYPAGHEGKFLGEKVTLLEKTETLEVSGLVLVQPEAPVVFELELQACDDKSCLAPAWVPVTITVLPEE